MKKLSALLVLILFALLMRGQTNLNYSSASTIIIFYTDTVINYDYSNKTVHQLLFELNLTEEKLYPKMRTGGEYAGVIISFDFGSSLEINFDSIPGINLYLDTFDFKTLNLNNFGISRIVCHNIGANKRLNTNALYSNRKFKKNENFESNFCHEYFGSGNYIDSVKIDRNINLLEITFGNYSYPDSLIIYNPKNSIIYQTSFKEGVFQEKKILLFENLGDFLYLKIIDNHRNYWYCRIKGL